ncbi:hypothetical protein BKA62DRAFT_67333 [Auriculariales sp. MPI-PUGE-AT-0066]|nr:hypothetical protein BKA62DRAFT_776598 [Auriculariales sp. MPI-PUGE-AT-0066]KAH7092759.1 hypothetical protein BKA62DRAFT_67333 [Auriculariales sp. MPI-PUGE-AT-0066]
MTTYDLLYFPISMALGDTARLLLALGDAPYTFSAPPANDFGSIKGEQLFGKIPRLTVKTSDGKETHLWESRAIHEYLAVQFGLLPTNDEFARAHLNSFVFSIYEIFDSVFALSSMQTPEARKEYWTALRDTKIPASLAYHEKYLASKAASGPYYAGDKITLPDVVLFAQSYRFAEMFGENAVISEAKTPHLYKLVNACNGGKLGETVRSWEVDFARKPRFDHEQFKWIF